MVVRATMGVNQFPSESPVTIAKAGDSIPTGMNSAQNSIQS